MGKKKNNSTLFFSCLHTPYQHKDAWKFLFAVADTYNLNKIVCLGDERDAHYNSYHETDPNLYGAKKELDHSLHSLKKLYKMFPEMDLLESNHGSMVARKAKTAGITTEWIRSIKEVMEAPKGYNWHDELTINRGSYDIKARHYFQASALMASKNRGCCIVQGHAHSKFDIQWFCVDGKLYWGMTVGCLIDKTSPAFYYNKGHKFEPVLGCGFEINGVPYLVPMNVNTGGRWDGKVNKI